jgi:hypothetical protein
VKPRPVREIAEASQEPTCKFQIPPDLVVKIQTVDIVEVIVSLSRRQSASQGWVATGNHGVSGSLRPSPLGLPLNPLECGHESHHQMRRAAMALNQSSDPRAAPRPGRSDAGADRDHIDRQPQGLGMVMSHILVRRQFPVCSCQRSPTHLTTTLSKEKSG